MYLLSSSLWSVQCSLPLIRRLIAPCAVLLNALIAMMNTTYANVFNEQEAAWRLQFLEQVAHSKEEIACRDQSNGYDGILEEIAPLALDS